MKNKMILLGFVLFFFTGITYSQSMDILSLEIKELQALKIKLQKFGKDTVLFTPAEQNLNTNGSSWVFNITAPANTYVVINNTEAADVSDTIKNFPKSLQVKNGIIFPDSFHLQKYFNIQVRNASNDSLVKSYDISYNEKAPSNAGALLDNDPAHYKVGSMIYDAIYLANGTNDIIKAKIFSCYGKGLEKQALIDEYADNKFLSGKVKRIINRNEAQNGGVNLGSITSAIGGLDVTSLADGLAKFLVKRTKAELNIAFFDKFKTFISKYPDLRTVFPETYKALTIIGDEIYSYQAYIQTLRESFEKDLGTLDKNLPSIIENHPDFFHAHPALAATLNSGCYIAGALDDKVHPGDILKDYPADFLDSLNGNWKAAIQTLQLFSGSFRDTTEKTDSVYWVSSKQVKSLIKDSAAFKNYLGLICQEAKNKYDGIHYSNKNGGKTLTEILNQLGGEYDTAYSSYKNFIIQFIDKANKLNAMIKNYKKSPGDSLAFEQYYNYFNSSIDLLQHCVSVSKLKYVDAIVPNLADSLKDYFDVVRSSADLVLDIRRRNYASAIVNTVHIYDLVKAKHNRRSENDTLTEAQIRKADKKTDKEVSALVEKIAGGATAMNGDAINALRKNNYTGLNSKTKVKGKELKIANKQIAAQLIQWAAENPSLAITKELIDSLRRIALYYAVPDDTLRKMYKYGAFMATMVQAKSSDDVEKAIEAFALPTGSARIKRESAFNVSLNAYTGLYAGYEHIKGVDNNCWKINSYGVTAPIGVAVSKGHSLFFLFPTRAGWSTSLFVSLLDVGAVAAFRFKNDSTEIKNNSGADTLTTSQVPAIQLKNIISPGAFLSIGIPRSPLSVNLGVQMGPNLRKVTSTNNVSQQDYGNNIYWRYSISLCVDIPILNFYTKSR